jgi:predicted nucleotidyltransferase
VTVVIEERQQYSDQRFRNLQDALKDAPGICEGKACIYATGSFGRREACEHSDIDLFIVSLCDGERKEDKGRLTRLNGILLKADLIRAARSLKFIDFSKDGEFLEPIPANSLIQTTGDRNDDAANTFTARLLLLLESMPLTGAEVHAQIINDVIAKYWIEFPTHSDKFMPAYLANDILRFWRTLCLNYEASTSEKTLHDRAKRKVKNYKLKHSRMLTCYSALLFLLYVYTKNGTVEIPDAQEMVHLTPTQRLKWVAEQLKGSDPSMEIDRLLDQYDRFLNVTNASEEKLIELFSDDSEAHDLRDEQSAFGDMVYRILYTVGQGSLFYKRLVV